MAIQLLSSFYVYLRCIQSLHHNIYSIFWSGQMSADGSVFTEASFSSLLFSQSGRSRNYLQWPCICMQRWRFMMVCVDACLCACVEKVNFFLNWPLLGMFLMLKQKQVWLRMRWWVTVNLPTLRTWSFRFKGWFWFPQNNCRPCNMGHKKSEIINT